MVTLYAYDFLLLLIGLERLLELKISAYNKRVALLRGGIEVAPGHFQIMRVLHIALLVGCVLEPRLRDVHFALPWGLFWLVLAMAAQVLRYSCIWALGPAWNVRIIVVPGEQASTRGPYRYLRHPNYVAVVLDGIALPLVSGCWVTATCFTLANALLLTYRIRCEQEALFAHLRDYDAVGRA